MNVKTLCISADFGYSFNERPLTALAKPKKVQLLPRIFLFFGETMEKKSQQDSINRFSPSRFLWGEEQIIGALTVEQILKDPSLREAVLPEQFWSLMAPVTSPDDTKDPLELCGQRLPRATTASKTFLTQGEPL